MEVKGKRLKVQGRSIAEFGLRIVEFLILRRKNKVKALGFKGQFVSKAFFALVAK